MASFSFYILQCSGLSIFGLCLIYVYEFKHGDCYYCKNCPPVSGRLSGNVGGIAESGETAGFGNIYVDRIALWAQVISTGRRNCGPAYVLDSSSPSSVRIYVYAPNIVKLGFSGGTHHPGGYQLWSSTYSSGNEYVPPDP
jgi:hypothetical protein